jgi:SM-20-related protein
MKEWKIDWGGETIFWDRGKREIVKSILPKSNRLILFESNIWHGARPLSRYCSMLRITLMFKFILE